MKIPVINMGKAKVILTLYGCVSWFITLRTSSWSIDFEKSVLNRAFGTKRNGVTGERKIA